MAFIRHQCGHRSSTGDECLTISLERERQVNVRVVPTEKAIEESVDLAHETSNRVFGKAPEKLNER